MDAARAVSRGIWPIRPGTPRTRFGIPRTRLRIRRIRPGIPRARLGIRRIRPGILRAGLSALAAIGWLTAVRESLRRDAVHGGGLA